MSIAEYFELIGSATEQAGASSMHAVQIYFAYIIAAYLAGPQMTRFQCIALSVMYSVFLTFPVLASLGQLKLVALHEQQFLAAYPEVVQQYYPSRSLTVQYFIDAGMLLWLSGWILSLVFMINSRRNRKTN